MDERPPGGSDQQPEQPTPTEPPRRAEPAPLPWERPQTPPPDEPRSTIISAEPVLTDEPGPPGPEVAWAAPPPPSQGREVPGAPGFVFANTPRRFVAWMIDNILLAVVALVLGAIIASVANVEIDRDSTTYYAIFSVISVGLSLLYFVLFWTSSWKATPGMRALQLQVGTAFEGRPLEMGPALIRWALLGYPLGLVSLIPAVASLVSLFEFVWLIALLVSTIASDTKQGLHDRAVGSAVVQPANAERSAVVTACLVIVVGLIALWFILIVFLLFLGGQMENILEEVGRSI